MFDPDESASFVQAPVNIAKAISFKLGATLAFALMAVQVRMLGATFPVGQIVFYRSLFALVPILGLYALRNELITAVRTRRPLGHVVRGAIAVAGMFFTFSALARLPLVNATAISFLQPLITVGLAALVLHERVRFYRWAAAALGFSGVFVMLAPNISFNTGGGAAQATMAAGAVFGLMAAFTQSAAVIQIRRLTETETTGSIVFYFSIICTVAGLATLVFGWEHAGPVQIAMLIGSGITGGIGQLCLTESYRHAPASAIAVFDYVAIIWAFILGATFFGEFPTTSVYLGCALVVAAGLYVARREGQLRLPWSVRRRRS